MDQIDNYVDFGIILFALLVFVFLGIKYLRCWQELQKAILKSGAEWPLHSQKELNETTRENLLKGYGIIGTNMKQAARILFTMKTDNPLILKLLRSMRRSLILFILFPFFLMLVLILVYAFLAV